MKNDNFSFLVKDSQFKKTKRSRIITWCVLVAKTPYGVAVRDSKDLQKTTLYFKHKEWELFVKGVKDGEFD